MPASDTDTVTDCLTGERTPPAACRRNRISLEPASSAMPLLPIRDSARSITSSSVIFSDAGDTGSPLAAVPENVTVSSASSSWYWDVPPSAGVIVNGRAPLSSPAGMVIVLAARSDGE